MKVYYFKARGGNFGDDLNAWMWPRLIDPFEQAEGAETWLIGIGTILGAALDDLPGRKLVLGAGARPGAGVPSLDAAWDVRFVRGPLSVHRLSLDASKAITARAILVRYLRAAAGVDEAATTGGKGRIALFPHYHSHRDYNWRRIARAIDADLIDPGAGIERTMQRIANARLVVTEAMHGAIVADALRTPWRRLICYSFQTERPFVSEFKWLDWAMSMNLTVEPLFVPFLPRRPQRPLLRLLQAPAKPFYEARTIQALGKRLEGDAGQLSDKAVLDERLTQLREQLSRLDKK